MISNTDLEMKGIKPSSLSIFLFSYSFKEIGGCALPPVINIFFVVPA